MPEVSPTIDSTVAFYDDHAAAYAAMTEALDISALYAPFLRHLPPGGHILDAGSGSGRDTAAFLALGYRVTAFDASAKLAAYSSAKTNQPTLVLRFEDVAWAQDFDGVWASASLLHLPAPELNDAIYRLARALRPSGVLFASFQEGTGTAVRDGRIFTLTTANQLRDRVGSIPELDIISVSREADRTRYGLTWLQLLAIRTNTAP